MPKVLVRISPDGKKTLHLHNDKLRFSFSDPSIHRATDVFFDNELKKWRVKLLREDMVLDFQGDSRQEAIEHEILILEEMMRERIV